jgi:hypothetical protein
MATCRDHGKVIDDAARVLEYPEELLLEFKREHEQRIQAQTSVTEEMRTHVLLFQAPIDGYLVQIDSAAVVQALLPRYPAEEQPLLIDLGDMSRLSDAKAFFSVSSGNLAKQMDSVLRRRPDGQAIVHLSVFALAPVPLLIQLGQLLGDIKEVDAFQRHRDTQDWRWKEDGAGAIYHAFEENASGSGEIGLVLSITQDVNLGSVRELLGDQSPLFVLRAHEPSLDFFNSRQHLQAFGYEIRKLLHKLKTVAGNTRKVNLFAAVPSPAAIDVGRNIRPYHPRFVLWEYEKGSDTYVPALELNE